MKYFIFLAILALVACQSEQKAPAHIYVDYYVRYLQTEQQLKAHAAFYEGDTLETARSLTFENDVKFQGYKMLPRQVEEDRTMRYVFNGTGTYDSTFLFQYTDTKGQAQEYKISMAPIRDFSIVGEASRDKGIVLKLEGEPFQANESLIMLFTSEKNQSAMAEFKGPFDLEELKVPPVQLMKVEEGKNFLYLVKKQVNSTQSGNMDITSSAEFYTKVIELQIVK